jgi:hypothetical protein
MANNLSDISIRIPPWVINDKAPVFFFSGFFATFSAQAGRFRPACAVFLH